MLRKQGAVLSTTAFLDSTVLYRNWTISQNDRLDHLAAELKLATGIAQIRFATKPAIFFSNTG